MPYSITPEQEAMVLTRWSRADMERVFTDKFNRGGQDLIDETVALIGDVPAVDYRKQRARAYAEVLSDGNPDPLEAIGDLLDAFLGELQSLRAAVGGEAEANFAAKATKIAAVKARITKE